jgi:ferredoxin
VRLRWQWLLDNLDLPLAEAEAAFRLRRGGRPTLTNKAPTRRCSTACRTIRCACLEAGAQGPPRQHLRRRACIARSSASPPIHKEVLRGRVFVALHMHAGDGNVHTNIPVNSDNYEMLQTANKAVERIMHLARGLDGVISGEHGIGITKLEFLAENEIGPFRAYKQKVDPEGRFNKGKLMPGGDMGNAYTPSFSLLGTESLIMEQSEIGKISDMVKDCLRCGKCKPVCSTHVPRANLLYSPRNKILATSLLVEAFLYEEQTRRGISLKHFDEFNDVADHCTVCHRCVKPCPVDIDFGDVSVAMRNFLRKQGKKRFSPAKAARRWPSSPEGPGDDQADARCMMDFGFKAQRLAHRLARPSA